MKNPNRIALLYLIAVVSLVLFCKHQATSQTAHLNAAGPKQQEGPAHTGGCLKNSSARPLRSLRLRGENFSQPLHRRGAEYAETAQRRAQFSTDSTGGITPQGETFHFRGAIAGTLEIQMKLVREGERLAGTYFYSKIGKDIEVRGAIDKDGNLTLKEFGAGAKETGIFKGAWKPASETDLLALARIEGTWSRPDGSKEAKFELTEEPILFTGPQRIVPKEIKEAHKESHYSIEVEYPQVEGAGDSRFEGFNKEARSLVTKQVNDWKREETAPAGKVKVPPEVSDSYLSVGYDIRLATDDLISVDLAVGTYSRGAAHPNSFTVTLNYDLTNNRKLTLGDLFNANSNYLKAVSAYCIKDLKAQSKKDGNDTMLVDDNIETGASPKAENFRAWAVTREGLFITFDPYQVAPYAAGPQFVMIPYAALKDIIRPDGPLAPFVK